MERAGSVGAGVDRIGEWAREPRRDALTAAPSGDEPTPR